METEYLSIYMHLKSKRLVGVPRQSKSERAFKYICSYHISKPTPGCLQIATLNFPIEEEALKTNRPDLYNRSESEQIKYRVVHLAKTNVPSSILQHYARPQSSDFHNLLDGKIVINIDRKHEIIDYFSICKEEMVTILKSNIETIDQECRALFESDKSWLKIILSSKESSKYSVIGPYLNKEPDVEKNDYFEFVITLKDNNLKAIDIYKFLEEFDEHDSFSLEETPNSKVFLARFRDASKACFALTNLKQNHNIECTPIYISEQAMYPYQFEEIPLVREIEFKWYSPSRDESTLFIQSNSEELIKMLDVHLKKIPIISMMQDFKERVAVNKEKVFSASFPGVFPILLKDMIEAHRLIESLKDRKVFTVEEDPVFFSISNLKKEFIANEEEKSNTLLRTINESSIYCESNEIIELLKHRFPSINKFHIVYARNNAFTSNKVILECTSELSQDEINSIKKTVESIQDKPIQELSRDRKVFVIFKESCSLIIQEGLYLHFRSVILKLLRQHRVKCYMRRKIMKRQLLFVNREGPFRLKYMIKEIKSILSPTYIGPVHPSNWKQFHYAFTSEMSTKFLGRIIAKFKDEGMIKYLTSIGLIEVRGGKMTKELLKTEALTFYNMISSTISQTRINYKLSDYLLNRLKIDHLASIQNAIVDISPREVLERDEITILYSYYDERMELGQSRSIREKDIERLQKAINSIGNIHPPEEDLSPRGCCDYCLAEYGKRHLYRLLCDHVICDICKERRHWELLNGSSIVCNSGFKCQKNIHLADLIGLLGERRVEALLIRRLLLRI